MSRAPMVLVVMSLGQCVWACGHSWDDYDPRLSGSAVASTGTGANGSAGGGGGTGGVPTATSVGGGSEGGAMASGGSISNGGAGAATGGEGGAVVEPCGGNGFLKGRFATWCGKVNVHKGASDAEWTGDTDCVSGCNINGVGYCQKYWPTSTVVIPVRLSPENKPFHNAECATLTQYPGEFEFVCCGGP